MNTNTQLSIRREVLSCLSVLMINGVAAFLVLPPPVSEIGTNLRPNVVYVLGIGAFCLYLLSAPRLAKRFWASIGASVGNCISVVGWSYYIWQIQ